MTTPQAEPWVSGAAPDVVLDVTVLGEPALSTGGAPAAYPAGRPGRLLAALLLARGHPVSGGRLIEEVWPDELPADPRAALHTTVARVRRALGPLAANLERVGSGYRLDRPGLRLDADEFTARTRPVPGESVPQRLARLDAALALWHGPAWGELAEDLARGDAARLEELRLAVREDRAQQLLLLGREAEATGELRLLVDEHPLREGAVALLMTALHRSGDVSGALAAYAAYRRDLGDELGLDPSPTLRDLHQQVLRREDDALPGPAAGRPRVPGQRVSPTPDDATGGVRLHGRAAHVSTLAQMLDLHRCVTVVGPGGVGKTSLVRQVVLERPHWWVELTGFDDPGDVRPHLAEVLGVEVFPGEALDAALHRRLAAASGVLVLDNCEHLLPGVVDLVDEILAAGPEVTVAATTRERLGHADERVFPLPPLALPPPGAVDVGSPAVTLFLERARAVAPELGDDEETLRAVCALVRRLDGLPLAIELAAGRTGTATLDDLRRRLDLLRSSAPRTHTRHRTLMSTVAWSYQLLSTDEQAAFRRLSVFAGGFDLDAAEAVLDDDGAGLVVALAERSLLVRPGVSGRYRMLETLRAFARAELTSEEEHAARRAHARWLADLSDAAAEGMLGAEESAWARRLDAAAVDLASGLSWTVSHGERELAARIVSGLHRWAYFRLRPDLLRWSLDVLALHDEPGPVGVHLTASAYFWMTGQHVEARRHGQVALGTATEGSHEQSLALDALSDIALAVGDLDEAERIGRRNYDLSLAAGRWCDVAAGACAATLATVYAGRPEPEMLRLAEVAAARAAAPCWRAMVRYCAGELLAVTDPAGALAALEEASVLARELDNRLVVGVSLTVATALRCRTGPLDATTVAGCIEAVEHWIGTGNENLFVTCLRNHLPLLDRFGAHRALVELAAATGREIAGGTEAERLDEILDRAWAALGDEAWAAAWAAGSARTPVAAGRVLVDELRSLVRTDLPRVPVT